MAVANEQLSALPDQQRAELESWLVRFDASWRQGRLAAWAAKLPPPGDPMRTPALIEMVKIDLERQWERGRRVDIETYLKAYPELGTTETVPADLIQAEYEVRNQFEGPISLGEYEQRFPQQAERLGCLVEQARQIIAETETYKARDPRAGGKASPPPARPTGPPDKLPETFGRYRIVKRLGRGGMGSVYLAHDEQLDPQVAVKVPQFAPEDPPEVLERFHREAKAAATIEHPNLCPVYDVGEIDGVHYLTMAYIEGKPLSRYTESPNPLDQRQVAAVVRKLALAMEEAHSKGVVHRDLKPANIMINARREPVILDFGLARREGHGDATLTQSGAVMGTPAYMAPEQVRGCQETIGPPCDVYALGVILYELLTRQRPFRGNVAEVLGQILHAETPVPDLCRGDGIRRANPGGRKLSPTLPGQAGSAY